MKLYDCKTAPSPRRVRIFAAEKNMQLEMTQVDLASGEQFGAAFSEINPECAVPVLELDDGTRITEVLAICQYLEEIQPEPALIGRTPESRAMAMMWAIKGEQQGFVAIQNVFRNSVKGLKGKAVTGPVSFEQIPELVDRGRLQLMNFFDRLDRALEGQDFLVGGVFSIADITALVVVDFAGWVKLRIPDSAANLQRWYEAVSARPSTKA